MIKCPKCGRENKEDAQLCTYCGEPLIDLSERVATRIQHSDFEDGVPKWGSARFNQRTNLVLGINGEVRTMVFDADQIEELILGRKDPRTGESPSVELSGYEALEKGVSRVHAAIIHKDGSLHLVDKGSANGTFLNGSKLVPNQPRVLRDGDDIRLGHLVIRITFERVERA